MTVLSKTRLIVAVLIVCAACERKTTLSTEEIIGEWEKPGRKLPPVSLLITSEGIGLRGRLRLSGVERAGSARVSGTQLRLKFDSGTQLRLKFDDPPREILGDFISRTELDIRLQPDREVYRLKKRP